MKRKVVLNNGITKKIKLDNNSIIKDTIKNDEKKNESDENLKNKKFKELDPVNVIKLDNLINNSNSFLEMQISELLMRRRFPDKAIRMLKKFLISFKKTIKTSIPSSENLAKIICPLDKTDEIFNYHAPTVIQFCYSMQTVLLDKITFINIVIEIPKMCIHSKDYLNGGYFYKRGQYLKHVMAVLYDIPKYSDFKFCVDFDRHLPMISFTSSELKKYKIEFIIETSIDDVFKVSRFTQNINNVRKIFYHDTFKFCVPNEDEGLISNTYYDSCILKEMLITKHRIFCKESLINKNIFFDVIILIKLWLSKKNINFCLLNDVIITFVIYLWDKNKINEQMTMFEIFNIFCTNLAKSNWNKEGIYFSNLVSRYILPFEYFQKNYKIVFTDRSGAFNLCYDWTMDQYNLLRLEARMACDLINSETLDKFRQLFLDEINFYEKYDYIFQIDTECLKNIFTQSTKLAPILMNYFGDYIKLACIKISEILGKGLGKRIFILNYNLERYLISPDMQPIYPFKKYITFGVLVNKEYAYVTEERGPVANSDEAADFLKFWGEISEQYHHPGENVCEVVKWNYSNILERRLIIMKIVKHLLLRHFNISKKSVIFYGQQLDSILQSPVSINPGIKESIGTGEEIHDSIIRLSDALSKALRNIPDLPLPINSVQGLSPIFRYSDVIPYSTAASEYVKTYLIGNCAVPMITLVPPFKPFYEVICLLEGSGKWPDDREAVKRLKSAFYIKLAPNLKRLNYSIKVHPAFMDIIPPNSSVIFRIKVGFLHEINHGKKTVLDDGKIMMVDNDDSRRMELRLVTLPKLSSTLHGLQQQHNTFGYACRLCKRWISAQLLIHQFAPETIDLIVAYLYVSPRSQSAPCSQLSAFLQFLHLVVNFDWNLQPLVVNLNNGFSQSDLQEIELFFNNNTSSNPCMFISYPDDKFSQKWTAKKPTRQAVRRLIAVARASLTLIENCMINYLSAIDDFKKVFRPPINDFDLIIDLHVELCPRYPESIDYGFTKNKEVKKFFFNSENLYPVINFDPVESYITDLEDVLGEFLTFFNDQYGGVMIAGVWKKSAFRAIDFAEDQLEYRKLSEKKSEEGLLVPSFEKIIDKIEYLGKGIVKDIKILNKIDF